MKRTIIISLITVVVVAATISAIIYFRNMTSNFTTLNANDFEKAIADTSSTTIIDVRTADEFADGHIPNAINIDVNSAGFLYEADEKLPKDRTIAVYCQGGVRSRKAATLLSDSGFAIINLDGGIKEWCKAGKEIAK